MPILSAGPQHTEKEEGVPMCIATLQSVLKEGQAFAPDTWDGISTKAAETIGCKTALFSATAYAHSVRGIPDEGVLGVTETVWAVSRLVEDNCSIPLVIDIRSGFSDNLKVMPYDLYRIVKAGAAAVMMDDRAYGSGADSEEVHLVSAELFAKKIALLRQAVENTDCMVIARSFSEDPEDAVKRLLLAKEAGAEIIGAAFAHTEADARLLAEKLPGMKLWNDLTVDENGDPEVSKETLDELGYRLVFMTFMEKAAWYGDMDFGIKNLENGSTVYADTNDFGGMLRDADGKLVDYHVIFSYWKKWMPLEKKFMDLQELGPDAFQFK